jgi:hypothetical protein
MREHHYLGFGWFAGKSIKHVALLDGEWVALLGWATSALKVSSRDKWIGWTEEVKRGRLPYVANNSRFLVLPGERVKNLASKSLALSVRRLSRDWATFHGHPVHLAETFVDPSRFAGTCYKAAGWLCLGTTRGFGYHSGVYRHHGQPKTVWVRPLSPEARKILSDPSSTTFLTGEPRMAVSLEDLRLDGSGGLWEHLASLPDPRSSQGRRHSLISILKIIMAAIFSGAEHAKGVGEWAGTLSQELLQRLGCQESPSRKCFLPPSWTTLHRVIRTIDGLKLERVLRDWILSLGISPAALAVDGKTLRGSASETVKAVHLLSAFFHLEGVVLSQLPVDEKSNEIPAFRELLAPLDIAGVTVTADAMHTQREHARFLVEDKKADFVMTVKDNQPELREALADPDNGAFSPSG